MAISCSPPTGWRVAPSTRSRAGHPDILARDGNAALHLDLRPDGRAGDIAARLARPSPRARSRANALRALGLSPRAVAVLREVAGGLPAEPAALAGLLKAVPLEVTARQSLARAISTAGGVAFAALDERLMLEGRPGVFVAGEMLDWEAPTGGYLLQACLATGHWAARGVAAYLAARRDA
ncbi:MAG: NAD(P)/FAD-dependent oxidoreductase [Geminicoccaceae bacterium]